MQRNLNQTNSLILTSLLLLFFSIPSLAGDEQDVILWNTTSLQAPFSPSYSMKLSMKNQYFPQINRRKETYLDLAVYRKMNDWLQLGLAFRGAQHVKTTENITEYRPQFITKIAFGSKAIKYTTTNRFEYRIFNNNDQYFRYYHNFFINFPMIGKLPKPYLGEEVFIKFNAEAIHLTRLFVGLHLLNREHFKIDAFYGIQHSKSDDAWYNSNIFGVNLGFQL